MHHMVEDALLDVQPRSSAAALTLIEEDGARRSGDGCLHVGVREDQVGRLATQFEGNLFQVAGRRLQNQSANFGGTGEGDFVDVRMRRQCSSCLLYTSDAADEEDSVD